MKLFLVTALSCCLGSMAIADAGGCGDGSCSVGQNGKGRHAVGGENSISGHSSSNGEAGRYYFVSPRSGTYFEAGANTMGKNDVEAGVIKENGVIISSGNRNR